MCVYFVRRCSFDSHCQVCAFSFHWLLFDNDNSTVLLQKGHHPTVCRVWFAHLEACVRRTQTKRLVGMRRKKTIVATMKNFFLEQFASMEECVCGCDASIQKTLGSEGCKHDGE